MRKLTIIKIGNRGWEVKGEGISIITDTKKKAQYWKKVFGEKKRI